MKRTLDCVSNYTRSKAKRIKLIPGIPTRIIRPSVSSTSVHNYFFRDTCVDWLKCKNKGIESRSLSWGVTYNTRPVGAVERLALPSVEGAKPPSSLDPLPSVEPPRGASSGRSDTSPKGAGEQSDTRLNWIFEQGKEFERSIVDKLSLKYNVVFGSKYYSADGCKRTLKLMEEGVEIIHSGCVKSQYKNLYGITDLLVRSDIFDKEFAEYKDTYNTQFDHGYHYVVIEIKNKKFKIDENCNIPSKAADILAYKSQLYVYITCLNDMQNIKNSKAYFIGKSYTFKNTIFDSITYNKIPVAMFDSADLNIKTLSESAVNWVKNVRNNWFAWDTAPPSNGFLYPNMKSKYNMSFYSEKLKIAEDIGEITMIMYCGLKQRDKAFSKGIYSWKDPLLTSAVMGLTGKRASLIDSIISMNRDQIDSSTLSLRSSPRGGRVRGESDNRPCGAVERSDNIIKYKKIPDVCKEDDNTIYLDIETFENTIYTIGFMHKDKYINFFIDSFDSYGEQKLLKIFQEFLVENNINKIYHHSMYDYTTIRNKYKKYNINMIEKIEWYDTWLIFYECEIVVKGLFDYKLKNIWKILKKYSFIQTNGNILKDCSGGIDSMNLAYMFFNKNTQSLGVSNDSQNILIRYNKFDCKVLRDIVIFLRTLKSPEI